MKLVSFLFALLVFLLLPFSAFAQEALRVSITAEPTVLTPTPVNYTLAYPGILPDNPLYPIKTLRDNIIGWLITNPLKKANFDVLQSDKRFQSGIFLLQKEKAKLPLVITTMSKGENYMIEAISKVQQAKNQGMATMDIQRKVVTAIAKHQEVLHGLSASQQKSLAGIQQQMSSEIYQIKSWPGASHL